MQILSNYMVIDWKNFYFSDINKRYDTFDEFMNSIDMNFNFGFVTD